MDPADAFVNLYDELRKQHGDTLSDWSVRTGVRAVRDAVRDEVRSTGSLAGKWISDFPDEETGFGVLLGLDLALLDANADTSHLAFRALDYLQVRLEMNGRLNDETGGVLLPRRTHPLRPTSTRRISTTSFICCVFRLMSAPTCRFRGSPPSATCRVRTPPRESRSRSRNCPCWPSPPTCAGNRIIPKAGSTPSDPIARGSTTGSRRR